MRKREDVKRKTLKRIKENGNEKKRKDYKMLIRNLVIRLKSESEDQNTKNEWK